MDTDTIKFITEQNKELKKDFRTSIADVATAVSARVDDKIELKLSSFEGKVDKILEHNVKQNGWIESHTTRLDAVENQTMLWRWVSRNPYKSIAILLILFSGLAYGTYRIDLAKVVKHNTGIELKVDEDGN